MMDRGAPCGKKIRVSKSFIIAGAVATFNGKIQQNFVNVSTTLSICIYPAKLFGKGPIRSIDNTCRGLSTRFGYSCVPEEQTCYACTLYIFRTLIRIRELGETIPANSVSG